MRSSSPTLNYYCQPQQQISPDFYTDNLSRHRNSSNSRSFLLPFQFQRKVPNSHINISCGIPSPTSPVSKHPPRLYNLLATLRGGSSSPRKRLQPQQSSPVRSSTGTAGRIGKFSNFHSSPTKSALRNLFRGSSGRKSVSFSLPGSTDSDGIKASSPLSSPAMDWKQSISTDHTDIAYRQAVSRLRSILTPRPRSATPTQSKENFDKTPNSKLLFTREDSPPTKRDRLSAGLRALFPSSQPVATGLESRGDQLSRSNTFPLRNSLDQAYEGESFRGLAKSDQDDLFGFIEKQAAYIAQLEKESNYSRNELAAMLNHVKQIVSENEQLHEKQKQEILTSMIQQLNEKTEDPGKPSNDFMSDKSKQVIRDSRVAELEAQLNQTKRTLRSAQEEILELRRTLTGNTKPVAASSTVNDNLQSAICEELNSQIGALNREKEDLVTTLTKLKEQINELRDRETEATKKVKASLEIVEQMQMEKAQSDLETRRVKDELDRHQQRIRDLIQEHSRKLYEEKMQVENKYRQEIDLLSNEMNQEMDTLTKSKIDLERQKRVEADLRRELQQRTSMIEDLRQEMQIKLNHLQNELSAALMQKSKGEQDMINSRLLVEKIERDSKQEVARLQIEIAAMRKRAEDADTDVLKSQEVIAKLNEKISQTQHENKLARIRLEERGVSVPVSERTGDSNSADVVSMIQVMEDKHSREMSELENLVQVQNNLLDKLRDECKLLTDKLEQTSQQYKREKQVMHAEQERLLQLNRVASEKHKDVEYRVQHYKSTHDRLTERIHRLEDEDKGRSDRIFQLLSKQSGLLKENQNLQNEIALLKCKRRHVEADDDPFTYSTSSATTTTGATSYASSGLH